MKSSLHHQTEHSLCTCFFSGDTRHRLSKYEASPQAFVFFVIYNARIIKSFLVLRRAEHWVPKRWCVVDKVLSFSIKKNFTLCRVSQLRLVSRPYASMSYIWIKELEGANRFPATDNSLSFVAFYWKHYFRSRTKTFNVAETHEGGRTKSEIRMESRGGREWCSVFWNINSSFVYNSKLCQQQLLVNSLTIPLQLRQHEIVQVLTLICILQWRCCLNCPMKPPLQLKSNICNSVVQFDQIPNSKAHIE